MFGRKKKLDSMSPDRVPVYKKAECLGEECEFYPDDGDCESRLELLEATGQSGGVDIGPLKADCGYALYGRVCMGGEEQLVTQLVSESPNGLGSLAEAFGRSGRYDSQRIVLHTDPDDIKFAD